MDECKHQAAVKVENGVIITYCKKCGKILDTKQAQQAGPTFTETTAPQNGGNILHG